MTTSLRTLLFVMLALAALPVAAQWSHVGVARMPGTGSACDDPLGPSRGEMFVIPTADSGVEDLAAMYFVTSIDGIVQPARIDWTDRTGAWQITGFFPVPTRRPAVLVTAWPDPAAVPMTEHRGLVLLDFESPEVDGWLHVNVAQEIPTPVVRHGSSGDEVTWSPLTVGETGSACEVGAEVPIPFISAWNVYRLSRASVPPSISTPDHYLCGPDLDCTTSADNGFVAQVPNQASPSDGLLHFTDPSPGSSDYVYVVQPVKMRALALGDADADTIPDEDLNGDGIPEFVDPSGNGRGLTARVSIGPTFRKPILTSPDSVDLKDVTLFVREVSGGYDVAWTASGSVVPVLLDLHAGRLADIRNPVTFAARDRLACGLLDGPGSTPLVDPAFASGNRHYLLSSTISVGQRWYEEYGTDSFGVERPATTTLPACR